MRKIIIEAKNKKEIKKVEIVTCLTNEQWENWIEKTTSFRIINITEVKQ